jgi:hypothetical protein
MTPEEALQRRERQARDKWEEEELAQKVTNVYPEAFDYVKIHEVSEISILDATDSESALMKKALLLISQKTELHLDVEALFEGFARKSVADDSPLNSAHTGDNGKRAMVILRRWKKAPPE